MWGARGDLKETSSHFNIPSLLRGEHLRPLAPYHSRIYLFRVPFNLLSLTSLKIHQIFITLLNILCYQSLVFLDFISHQKFEDTARHTLLSEPGLS
jgi:hypothetical protein